MRLYEIYYNNSTRRPYSVDMGSLGGTNLPYITTEEQVKIKVNILNSSNIADTYTGFTGELVSATATVDDNFDWVLDGLLLSDLTGVITEVVIDYAGDGFVNPIGQIYLTNSGGVSETVDYTSFVKVDDTYTFTVSKTLVNEYVIGDKGKISEVPLIRASSVITTNKNTGVFEIILEADALRYIEKIQGEERLNTCRFELLIRNSSADLIYVVVFNFICLNVQDFTGAIPMPQDPNEYVSLTDLEAYLAGKMNLLATAQENYIPAFEVEGELKQSSFRIEGNKIIGPDGAGGEGYMQFVLVNGVMTMEINKEL